MLNCINNDAIDVIQLPFNLFDNHNHRGELIREAKKNNKEIHIRSVFLQGLFFMNPANLSLNLKPLAPYLAEIQRIAMELDISIAELALAYVKKEPYIDRIIIGVDSAKQLENNFLASVFEMNDYIYNLINRLIVNETMLLNPQNWK